MTVETETEKKKTKSKTKAKKVKIKVRNNIVAFPVSRIVHRREFDPATSREELESVKLDFVDYALTRAMNSLWINLEMDGVNVGNKNFAKDMAFATEIVNAALMRSVDMKHPIHEFLDKNVVTRKEKKK